MIRPIALSLIAFALLAPHAHAGCDLKKAAEPVIEAELTKEHLALEGIDKVTPQGGDDYLVEYRYGGAIDDFGSFDDDGIATLKINTDTCIAKEAKPVKASTNRRAKK